MAQPYFYISNNEIQFLSHEVCRPKGWGEFRIVTLLMNMPIISSGNGNTLLLNAKGSTFPPPQEKRMGGIRKGKSL